MSSLSTADSTTREPTSQRALPSVIVKRDGSIVAFDLSKIANAIARAGAATGEFDSDEASRLAAQVGRVVAHRHSGARPHIEQIQDVVEHALIAAGHF